MSYRVIRPFTNGKEASGDITMSCELDRLNQPVGSVVCGWDIPPYPGRVVMEGYFCRLEPLEVGHAESLYAANSLDVEGRNWTYLSYGPFDTLADFRTWVEQCCGGDDPLFYAILDLARDEVVEV